MYHFFGVRMKRFWFAALLVSLWGGLSYGATIDTKSLGHNGGENAHPHNLSSLNTGGVDSIHAPAGGETQICKFCHTPHGAASRPLWNRPDPVGPNGDGSFPLYGGSSLVIDDVGVVGDSKYGQNTYPNGASRMCMSCHDGVTAIGQVVSEPAELANLQMSIEGTIDLSVSHPISFVYDTTVAGLINAQKNDGGTNTYQLPSSNGLLDGQNRMQCNTCHNPHVDTRDGVYNLPMWRKYTGVENDDYEWTCSQCHIGGPTSAGILWGSPGSPTINDHHDLIP